MDSSIEISKHGSDYKLICIPAQTQMKEDHGRLPSLTLHRIDDLKNLFVDLGLRAEEQKRLLSELETASFAETGVTDFPDEALGRFRGY